MSSYSSRYQSRLLNFISQQSHKVVDKCDRALRHLKFAAESALQATLYPVYLLVQTARALGRQLQQVGKNPAAQLGDTVNDESLNYPDADAPIQQVLSFVQDLSLPALTTETKTEEISAVNYRDTADFFPPNLGEIGQAELPVFKDLIATSADALAKLDNKLEKSSDSPLLALGAAPEISMCVKRSYPEGNCTLIVGVATAIATRNLVLVARENQTLDILTASQQQELQQKICGEVADFWQQRQRLAQSQLGFSNDLQLVANQTHLWGWFRPFLGVMSWVQTSPVAVKVNLFGEANLLLTQRDNCQVQISNYQLSIANSSLTSPPSAIALSEELPQAPAVKYTKYLTVNSLGVLQTKQPPQAEKIAHRDRTPRKLVGIERFENYIEQIIELILSAIAYFLGRKEQQSEKRMVAHLYAKYKMPSALLPEFDSVDRDRTSEAPWLSWSDLFGETTATTETNSLQEKINLLPRIAAETSYAPPSETLEFNRSSVTAQPVNTQNLSKVNPSATVSTQKTIATAVARKEQAESSSVKPAPDWWEAQVISRGYVKHPLEQTLEWLDTALLWLEEIGVQLWYLAKIQLHKIFSSKN